MEGKEDEKKRPAVEIWESGYEESVWSTRLVSRLVDFWPLENKNFLQLSYRAVPIVLIVGLLTVPQVRRLYKFRKDLNAVIEVLSTGILMEIISLLKLIGAWYNRPGLKKLLLKIAKDWEVSTVKEQVIMWKYARLTKIIMVFCMVLAAGNHTINLIRLLILCYIDIHHLDENETYIKPMFVKSDFYIDEQVSPLHQILFTSQYIACTYVNVSFIAYDGYFFLSMLHFSGQLYNLQKQIEEVVERYSERKCAFSEILAPVVERHRDICRYTSLIEENFNKIFLIQMIFTCIFLTLQGYEFTMIVSQQDSKLVANLMYITWWITSNIFSIFLYCFVAEQIRTQSEELFRSAFKIRWYDLPPKDSKMVIIIMNRTKAPIEITVGKFVPFSLEYFCSIMKTSAGYLSVLLAMRDKL